MNKWGCRIGLISAGFFALSLSFEMHASWAVEREELGQVLKIMPPNGPAEQYGNVVMRRSSKKSGMPPVVFPHWSHRGRYTCRVCHSELEFAMRSGGSGITRGKYLAGKFCGACHNGTTAFSVRDEEPRQCDRCHMKDTAALNKRFRSFAAGLPATSFGNRIDWGAALAEGLIAPQKTLSGGTLLIKTPEALQKPLDLGTSAPRSSVAFSHGEHLSEMDCSICHPDIFNIKKKGTRLFSMEINIYGQFCGVCHMRVAFPMNDCRRCHMGMGKNSSGY